MAIVLLGFMAAGCATNTITNLTPTQYPRNNTGVYRVEVQLDTLQQSMRQESISPSVIVGSEVFPMRPTLKMFNRWEGTITVPKDKSVVGYHFKFDYDYNRFGKTGRDSQLSSSYELKIAE